MWRYWNLYALLMGIYNGAAMMESSMGVPQNI
jgi:hypothetical protein